MGHATPNRFFGSGDYPQLVITGSYDYALQGNQAAQAAAYAVPPWSLGWLMRANHNGFNTVWTDLAISDPNLWSPDTVAPRAHLAFARALVVSQIRAAMKGESEQAAYFRGSSEPRSLRGIDGRIWYRPVRALSLGLAQLRGPGHSVVVDDFSWGNRGILHPGVNNLGGQVLLDGSTFVADDPPLAFLPVSMSASPRATLIEQSMSKEVRDPDATGPTTSANLGKPFVDMVPGQDAALLLRLSRLSAEYRSATPLGGTVEPATLLRITCGSWLDGTATEAFVAVAATRTGRPAGGASWVPTRPDRDVLSEGARLSAEDAMLSDARAYVRLRRARFPEQGFPPWISSDPTFFTEPKLVPATVAVPTDAFIAQGVSGDFLALVITRPGDVEWEGAFYCIELESTMAKPKAMASEIREHP